MPCGDKPSCELLFQAISRWRTMQRSPSMCEKCEWALYIDSTQDRHFPVEGFSRSWYCPIHLQERRDRFFTGSMRGETVTEYALCA